MMQCGYSDAEEDSPQRFCRLVGGNIDRRVCNGCSKNPNAGNISEMPFAARWIAKRKIASDAGVGDTLARLLGGTGERFKWWYRKIFGTDCGCGDRQQRLNQRFPYPT
jgi:hypothetical protein